MNTYNIPFFVINLDGENSRWENCLIQQSRFGFYLNRIRAIDKEKLVKLNEIFVSDGVRAVWLSHLKCFENFLSTDSSHALILEDDFQIQKPEKFSRLLSDKTLFEYDLVQFGFLKPGPDIAIRILIANIETTIFRLIARVGKLPILRNRKFRHRLRVREALNIPIGFTANDFQPGAHCYLISRRLAEATIRLNDPQFLSIDDFFTALSQMRTFKSIRVKRGLVSQAPFPKWKGERFLSI
jgi:GR25 family glycosyltransferase involved in LPS biosynthesis